jgi:septum formation protein
MERRRTLFDENVRVRLLLASQSPRRAELLRAAGFEFDIQPADADETLHPGEAADHYVRRVAEAKARAVLPTAEGRIVVAADTTVVVDRHILAKPEDAPDASRMLRLLSGRQHEVMTGVAIAAHGRVLTGVEVTRVEFAVLDADEIAAYVGTGEPMDKAGAYAVQGVASRFVTRIEGSHSNVVGLPVALVYRMLKELSPSSGLRL